jgi:rubredoxin
MLARWQSNCHETEGEGFRLTMSGLSLRESLAQTYRDIYERIERDLARQKERRQIKCPACGYVFDFEDVVCSGLVTYWGQDGPQEWECPDCEACLVVTEHVTREYDVVIAPVDESEERR